MCVYEVAEYRYLPMLKLYYIICKRASAFACVSYSSILWFYTLICTWSIEGSSFVTRRLIARGQQFIVNNYY